MKKTEIERYRVKLEAKRQEILAKHPGNRLDVIVVDCSGNDDSTQFGVDIWVGIGFVNSQSKLLRNIEGALQRIKDGVYGTCIACDKVIATKRLNAVPWTRHCINCKEDSGPELTAGRFRPEYRPK